MENKKYRMILEEIQSCDECLRLKMHGVIPACCQYHLNKQFEDF